MLRKLLCRGFLVPVLLCLQLIPLVIFPRSTYNLASQEWWLPLFLALLSSVSLIQLLLRRNTSLWPWYMLSFSQGFNIISRLMMLMPHATTNVQGTQVVNEAYVVIAFLSMLLSSFYIWYLELPEVRAYILDRAMAHDHPAVR
jgi:hypothetical protein